MLHRSGDAASIVPPVMPISGIRPMGGDEQDGQTG
jgi:hypothetical protein